MKKFVCSVCGYVYEGEIRARLLPHLQGSQGQVRGAGAAR